MAQQVGWRSLRDYGLVEAFQAWGREQNWPAWPLSEAGFYDCCTTLAPDGESLIACLLANLPLADGKAVRPSSPLPAHVAEVLTALVGLAIERWVQDTVCALQLKRANLDTGALQLALADEWVVYLMTTVEFKLRCRLEANLHRPPAALLTTLAPFEPGAQDRLAPVRAVVAQAYAGMVEVDPTDLRAPQDLFLKMILPDFNKRLKSGLVMGVRHDQSGHALQDEATRQQFYEKFKIPTVLYGTAQEQQSGLAQFAGDLINIITVLGKKLQPYSDPSKGNSMTQDDNKLPQPASVTNNNYGPTIFTTTATNVVQAPDNQGTVVGRDAHNHPASDAAFARVLDDFIAATRSDPQLASKQAYIEQRVQELKTLSEAPGQDAKAEPESGAKRALEDLHTVMERVERGSAAGSALWDKFNQVKDAVLVNWPSLVPWAAALFGVAL
jgi:hypothetical protein